MTTRSAVNGAVALACLLSAPVAVADPAGKTTLDETIRAASGGGYAALVSGPGEPYRLRKHPSAKPTGDRAKHRRSLAFFGQLTDPQIADEMSPARVDFLDGAGAQLVSSWRPQELFGPQVFDLVVRNLNANRTSTVTDGRGERAKLGFVITTGDLADNQQLNETRWFKGVLDGGTIDPFSGKPISGSNPCPGATQDQINAINGAVANRLYTGVADYDDYRGAPADRYGAFWDPDEAPPAGGPYAVFPRYPGLLERAQQRFTAEGLKVPWYIARGNHDGLVQGNASASNDIVRAIATGCLKVFPSSRLNPAPFSQLDEADVLPRLASAQFIQTLLASAQRVPPDPDRRILSTVEYKAEVGGSHGYRHVDASERRASKNNATYYTFRRGRGLELISLDTVAEGGGANGNLDNPQYRWLERKLIVAQQAKRLVIVFGHHTLGTMNNRRTDEQAGSCSPTPKPGCDADPRKSTPLHRGLSGRKNVRDLFLRYRNVIAYIAGHTHDNDIRLFRKGRTGFWQINTASHADFPQQSREIEVMDNRDGTLSLFTTVLDHAAPVAAPAPGTAAAALTDAQLGSLSRVLSWNDPQRDPHHAGGRGDRNAELVLLDPRRLQ